MKVFTGVQMSKEFPVDIHVSTKIMCIRIIYLIFHNIISYAYRMENIIISYTYVIHEDVICYRNISYVYIRCITEQLQIICVCISHNDIT